MSLLQVSTLLLSVIISLHSAILNSPNEIVDRNIAEVFGKHVCVPYHQCDPETNEILTQGVAEGKIITIIPRLGDDKCSDHLHKYCKVPPNFDPDNQIPPPEKHKATKLNYCGIHKRDGVGIQVTSKDKHLRETMAQFGEFPWMLGILPLNATPKAEILCGASLIAPNVAISAAHCFKEYKAENIKVRAGEWELYSILESIPFQESEVSKIIIHPQYNKVNLNYDVALVILKTEFKFYKNVATICLPTQDNFILSSACFVNGWGKKQLTDKQNTKILKKLKLPTVSSVDCQQAYRTTQLGYYFMLHDTFICAGGDENVDCCIGDGGGPLVCPDPNNNGRYVLTGIVSWGIDCGLEDIPGVYANVAKFRYWIDKTFKDENLNSSYYIV